MSEVLRTKRSRPNLARLTRTTGSVLGVFLLATGCLKIEYNGNDDKNTVIPNDVASASPTNTHTAPAQPDNLPEHVTYDPNFTFDQQSYCKWKFGTRPVPLSDTNPVQVRVDNRCSVPGIIDTHLDKDISIQKEPIDSGDSVASIVNGDEITLQCYRQGEEVANLRDRSSIWVKVTSSLFEGSGYVPDLSLGGGFSIGQLEGLGVEECKIPQPGK